jgi:hypothetical protein
VNGLRRVIAAVAEYSFSRRREPPPEAPAAETGPVILPDRAPEVVSETTVSDTVGEPEPIAVVPPTAPPAPRNWNLWDIERAQRERGEPDEEREYLLMYLRDYAGPDGQLPLEFDDLVRESFGELLGAPTG